MAEADSWRDGDAAEAGGAAEGSERVMRAGLEKMAGRREGYERDAAALEARRRRVTRGGQLEHDALVDAATQLGEATEALAALKHRLSAYRGLPPVSRSTARGAQWAGSHPRWLTRGGSTHTLRLRRTWAARGNGSMRPRRSSPRSTPSSTR